MMKRLLLLAAAALLPVVGAQAAAITFTAGTVGQHEIKTGAGVVATASTFKTVIGFFRNLDDAALRAAMGDPTVALDAAASQRARDYLAQNFVPLGVEGADSNLGGSAAGNPLGIKADGRFSGQLANVDFVTVNAAQNITANTLNDGGLVRGTKVFLLIHNGADVTATNLGTAFNMANELALVSGTGWVVNTGTLQSTTMAMSAIDTQAEIYRGTLGSIGAGAITPVPEPATFTLAGLAVLGLVGRRRRQA